MNKNITYANVCRLVPLFIALYGSACKPRKFNEGVVSSTEADVAKPTSPWPSDLVSMRTEEVEDVLGATGRCPNKEKDPLRPIFQKLHADYIRWILTHEEIARKMDARILPGTLIEHAGKPYRVVVNLGEGTRGISLWVREIEGSKQPFVLKLMKQFTDTNVKKEAQFYQLNHKAVLPAALLSRFRPFPYSGLVEYLDLDEETKIPEATFAKGTLRLKAIKGISGLFVDPYKFGKRLGFYANLPRYPEDIEMRAVSFLESVGSYRGASDIIDNFVLDVDCLSVAKIDPG